ncbi:MAG: hypothetical protein J6K12_07210 [Clostridia bacterium]|nr:hypothetical protein [Clostridia bacterium]
MSTLPVTVLDIDKNSICVNHRELCARLGVDKSFDISQYDVFFKEALDKCQPKCAYTCVPIHLLEEHVCDFGFMNVKSLDLYKNLSQCDKAFIFAVTLGINAERHLVALSKISKSRHYICDAFYSAFIEGVCDKAQSIISEGFACKNRFSPGYGDLSLEIQHDILHALDASKLLGITLTGSLLMTPQKSITAIMGIKAK